MRRLYLLVILFTQLQCSAPERLTPEELEKVIVEEKNRLTQAVKSNDYSISVIYRPTDLWIYQEADGLTMDSSEYYTLEKKYSDHYYFILSFSEKNREALTPSAETLDQYGELVQTMSFRMDQYVTLLTPDRDTIPTADFMLNRTYGLSNATNILVVFSKAKTKNQDWVEVNLNEFGLGVGSQRFRFRTKDLEETPKLKFKLV